MPHSAWKVLPSQGPRLEGGHSTPLPQMTQMPLVSAPPQPTPHREPLSSYPSGTRGIRGPEVQSWARAVSPPTTTRKARVPSQCPCGRHGTQPRSQCYRVHSSN